MLSDAFCGEPVDAVRSAEELISACSDVTPQVVVMDISLPGMNGVDATRWLKATSPGTEVVIHSNLDPAGYFEACQRAGASVYVRKAQPIAKLIIEIARLMHHETG